MYEQGQKYSLFLQPVSQVPGLFHFALVEDKDIAEGDAILQSQPERWPWQFRRTKLKLH